MKFLETSSSTFAWENSPIAKKHIKSAKISLGYGLTEFLSEDGVRLVTRDDIDMAVMEDGSCLVFITV